MTSWGDIQVGDKVTSQGRHGPGQPPIAGVVVCIGCGVATVQVGRKRRYRSVRNLRKVTP